MVGTAPDWFGFVASANPEMIDAATAARAAQSRRDGRTLVSVNILNRAEAEARSEGIEEKA